MISPDELMELAVQKARQGVRIGQTPFGCAVGNADGVIAVEHNTVLLTTDITAHAEVNALRAACKRLQRVHLDGCIVATTCEPCPMCMAALHWSRVATVYYGSTIADAAKSGFNELSLPASELLKQGGSSVRLVGGMMPKECRQLFSDWEQRSDKQVY